MQKHWVNSFRGQTSCCPLTLILNFEFPKFKPDFWNSSEEALTEILNPITEKGQASYRS